VAIDGICLPLLDGGDVLVVEEHLEPLLRVVVTQLLEGGPSWPKVRMYAMRKNRIVQVILGSNLKIKVSLKLELLFQRTTFNATGHWFSNPNKIFTFSQKINAFNIK
jgi:hypothetical protein